MSREVRAGGAFIELYIKERERLDPKFKGYQSKLQTFATGVAMVGSAVSAVAATSGVVLAGLGTGLGMAFSKFTTVGDDLTDAANRIGITTQRLQELKFAASQSGTSIEEVERAITQAQKKGLDWEKTFREIGKIEDPIERTQKAFAAFGKVGPKIAPMLKDLDALSAKARSLGLVFRPEDIAAGGKMKDLLEVIKAQLEAITFHIGSSVAPAMQVVFDHLQKLLADVIKTMKGINDAIATSDIPLAFQIAWTGALLEFEKFRSRLLMGIAHLGEDMLKVAAQIGKQFAKALLHGDIGGIADIAKLVQKPGKNIDRLQAELDRLINKAARNREKQMYLMPGLVQPPLPAAVKSGAQSGQFGAFNAAIASMASRTGQLSVEQKQLSVLEDLKEDIAVIRKEAEEGGLVFG